MGRFSAGERKVARALLAAYPIAGLETVAELGERAGVSAPTVVRFAQRLGYTGYPELQRRLHREVQERWTAITGPGAAGTDSDDDPATLCAENYADLLRRSFRELPASELDRTRTLLGHPGLRIHVLGGRFSHILATYLVAHLQLLRPDVHLVPTDEVGRVATVAAAGSKDLLVAFDYRRYAAGVHGPRVRPRRDAGHRPHRGSGAGRAPPGRPLRADPQRTGPAHAGRRRSPAALTVDDLDSPGAPHRPGARQSAPAPPMRYRGSRRPPP